MNEEINISGSYYRDSIISFVKKEAVLLIASSLALISSFISLPKVEYIDFKVLILLFNLMIIISAFKELNILDSFATYLLSKCKSLRTLSCTIVFITFFSAMLVTNDVALITFVPLTLIISKKANLKALNLIIFQTLAANLGSTLTPMGNPQNLYIYSYFNIAPVDFFKFTLPLVALSIVFLSIILLKENDCKINLNLSQIYIENKRDTVIFSLIFMIILLSVFHLIDYRIAFILTLITVLLLNKKLLTQVDYSLLLTFIAFFIFIGNISNINLIKNLMNRILDSGTSTYFSSIIASQFISNVPATMLISPFTTFPKELLLGVNIGGMGTLIASLASVISYKLFVNEYEELSLDYMKKFTFYNLLGLAVLAPIIFIL